MTDELLGKLRLLEFKCRDRWERAAAAMQEASKGVTAYPHTQDEMEQLEIDMLWTQADLARAEDEAQDDAPCPTTPVNTLTTTISLSGSYYPTEGTELKFGEALPAGNYDVTFTPIPSEAGA